MLTNGGLNFQRNGFIINPKTYKMIQHMRKYMRIVHTYMRNMRKYMRNMCKYMRNCVEIFEIFVKIHGTVWKYAKLCRAGPNGPGPMGRAHGPGP